MRCMWEASSAQLSKQAQTNKELEWLSAEELQGLKIEVHELQGLKIEVHELQGLKIEVQELHTTRARQ